MTAIPASPIWKRTGCAAIVCERKLETKIPQIIVPDSRVAMSLLAAQFYGNPAKKLKLIAVSGTNGKTTTCHILRNILAFAGKKAGVIGTLGVFYGDVFFEPELTTPDPIRLQKIFRDMADARRGVCGHGGVRACDLSQKAGRTVF